MVEPHMNIPQFGTQESGWIYEPRPGAYALIRDDVNRLLILHNTVGNFGLPGGGIDPGESPEQALAREVLEETGHAVAIGSEFCRANQYVVAPAESRAFNKQGIFYMAAFGEKIAAPTELDHFAKWMDGESVLRLLTEDSQRWAVAQFLKNSSTRGG